MDNLLQAQQLFLQVDKRMLISNISLCVKPGEIIALIGPNGAGKSTLLCLLSGFIRPTSGDCLLKGKSLALWPATALAQRRAVMKQQSSLMFSLAAKEVIRLGRAPWPGKVNEDIVNAVIAMTGCQALAGRNYQHLSGGEQQRVQLARVLAQLWQGDGPKGWLFLDEPTSALDLYHQQQLLRLLHRLTRQGELAVCVVLHDLNLASLWSDKLLLLSEGTLVAQGTPNEVLTESLLNKWYRAEVVVNINKTHQRPHIMLCH